jgi:hypothetical protein
MGSAAERALKPVRPSKRVQERKAVLFAAEAFVELHDVPWVVAARDRKSGLHHNILYQRELNGYPLYAFYSTLTT